MEHLKLKIQHYIKNGCEGDLNLEGTPIERLPENLKKVGGDLNLSHSKIKTISNDLHVDGCLYIEDTPLSKKYTIEELENMLIRIQGNIFTDGFYT